MPKKRDAVRMSEAEVATFVESRRSMIVATLNRDGSPHQTVLWFAVADGAYVFETYGTSQKVQNLRRDPRISLLWEAGETYDALQGVSVQGRAEIIDQGPELLDLMRLCVARNTPGLDPAMLDQAAAHLARKRVAIRVRPQTTFSWDHKKLAGEGPM